MGRAASLTSALGEEELAWKQHIVDLDALLAKIVGDVLVRTGCGSCMGAPLFVCRFVSVCVRACVRACVWGGTCVCVRAHTRTPKHTSYEYTRAHTHTHIGECGVRDLLWALQRVLPRPLRLQDQVSMRQAPHPHVRRLFGINSQTFSLGDLFLVNALRR